MLAKDLKKVEPSIQIDDHDVLLTAKGEELIRHVFVHLLRNSMDHGIESAEERVGAKKNKKGEIFVKLTPLQNYLQIEFGDDGRGLNLALIQEIAKIKGLSQTQKQDLTPDQLCELIFSPGFSTSQTVNEISGRGMGMEAVRQYIERLNGSIKIELKDSASTTGFVPFSIFLYLADDCYVLKSADQLAA